MKRAGRYGDRPALGMALRAGFDVLDEQALFGAFAGRDVFECEGKEDARVHRVWRRHDASVGIDSGVHLLWNFPSLKLFDQTVVIGSVMLPWHEGFENRQRDTYRLVVDQLLVQSNACVELGRIVKSSSAMGCMDGWRMCHGGS